MKRRWPVAIALLAALAWSAPGPAAASPAQVAAIGDSVMLGARSALQARGMRVDAKVNRQASLAPGILRAKGASLPHYVVLHLGTNGTFAAADCRRVFDAAGPDRTVLLVTIHAKRRWVAGNNKTLRQCAAMHADQSLLVDWDAAARQHPGWVYADGIHLRPVGAKAYAGLIAEAVERARGLGQ